MPLRKCIRVQEYETVEDSEDYVPAITVDLVVYYPPNYAGNKFVAIRRVQRAADRAIGDLLDRINKGTE